MREPSAETQLDVEELIRAFCHDPSELLFFCRGLPREEVVVRSMSLFFLIQFYR